MLASSAGERSTSTARAWTPCLSITVDLPDQTERELSEVKIGALCWNQYTDWPSLLEAGIRADRLGYSSLWTWDHLYPIVGSDEGPIFEGWLTLAAWAGVTSKVQLGLMVGANTFREPTVTTKQATTLDHISGGRAVLGIGAAWFKAEHTAYGLCYGCLLYTSDAA